MKAAIVLIGALAAGNAFASGGAGNGGDLAECVKGPDNDFEGYYSLDYLLTWRKSNQNADIVEVKSWRESHDRIRQIFEKADPELRKNFDEFSELLFQEDDFLKARYWDESPFGLVDLKDERMSRALPKNCIEEDHPRVIQAVIRHSGDREKRIPIIYQYDSVLLDKIRQKSPLQLSFLLVHEFLRDYLVSPEKIRRINRFIHSEAASQLPYVSLVKNFESLELLPGKVSRLEEKYRNRMQILALQYVFDPEQEGEQSREKIWKEIIAFQDQGFDLNTPIWIAHEYCSWYKKDSLATRLLFSVPYAFICVNRSSTPWMSLIQFFSLHGFVNEVRSLTSDFAPEQMLYTLPKEKWARQPYSAAQLTMLSGNFWFIEEMNKRGYFDFEDSSWGLLGLEAAKSNAFSALSEMKRYGFDFERQEMLDGQDEARRRIDLYLSVASWSGSTQTALMLLGMGADPNTSYRLWLNTEEGMVYLRGEDASLSFRVVTPLVVAVVRADLQLVKALLDHPSLVKDQQVTVWQYEYGIICDGTNSTLDLTAAEISQWIRDDSLEKLYPQSLRSNARKIYRLLNP